MNHDATHCLDYKKSCPKSCYRAQLTEEIRRCSKSIPLGLFNMISWAHFMGTRECPKSETKGEGK